MEMIKYIMNDEREEAVIFEDGASSAIQSTIDHLESAEFSFNNQEMIEEMSTMSSSGVHTICSPEENYLGVGLRTAMFLAFDQTIEDAMIEGEDVAREYDEVTPGTMTSAVVEGLTEQHPEFIEAFAENLYDVFDSPAGMIGTERADEQ